jgi:hypothetical protein
VSGGAGHGGDVEGSEGPRGVGHGGW